MNACTIIARNYLAQARVLARSFRQHHPAGRFTVLVIDGEQPFPKGPHDEFEVMVATEIGFDETELHRMAVIYDVMELATAVKAAFLKALLERGGGAITYFDPDIEIFRPLDDIDELARVHSIVLTPHTLDPLPHTHEEPGEVTLLLAGMFNLGFIAVGKGASDFLDWWAERLARSGHVDPKRAQFVDQRWVDFVPSLFDHVVLRDPGSNVAHWNLETRRFEHVDGEYRVDGQPLRFFHFSGFDPEKPYLLSKFLGPEPRILLSKHAALRDICGEYGEKLRAAGYDDAKNVPYGLDELPNGIALTKRMRRLYRRELAEAERKGDPEPPNPFDEGGADRFVGWLNEPMHPRAHGLTRYLFHLHQERSDLQSDFPDPRWRDRGPYLQWVCGEGRVDERIPAELLPEIPPQPEPPEQAETGGVNVAGYFRAEAGVGQAARHVLGGLKAGGIPHSTLVYDKTLSRQAHEFEDGGEPAYDVNIICVNADQLPSFAYDSGPEFFQGRHSIGIWWWEVSRFPERFHAAFELVNEIWVGSDFVARAIAAETDKPVYVLPLGLELPAEAPPADRSALGLPEGFLFLFSFDFDSRFERKNPLAVIEAFRQAFPTEEGPALLIKTINGDRHLQDLERLRYVTAGRADMHVVDGYRSQEDTAGITASCDCYVSLHRSEGFGLTLAEAMTHGKPVIATGYSGNLEFMSREVGYLVPYVMTPIPEGVDPYPPGSDWADPDVAAAGGLMRHVYENQAEAAELGRRARAHMAEHFSSMRTAAFIRGRLGEISEARDAVAEFQNEGGTARASRYLSEGPTAPIRGPSRFGFLGRLARRALYVVLRPYTSRRAEFDAAVVDGLIELRELLEQGLGAERSQRAKLAATAEQIAATAEQRAQSLGEDVNRVDRDLAALSGELNATPYLSDPEFFRATDSAGRELFGYTGLENSPAERNGYLGFEDIFRGSEEFIRDRQRVYVDILSGRGPVLDAGCGRGELLELLREHGVESSGVDMDEGMVARCRAKGLDVTRADVTEYLETVDDESLGAIFSAQVVEHMPQDKLLSFFTLARRKLGTAGVLIVETVNPHSIQAMKTFWVDPTHERPVFPEVALALCRLHGFGSAQVFFPNGSGNLEDDRRRAGEYAVVATVEPAAERLERVPQGTAFTPS